MINAILGGLIDLVMFLVNLLLAPIDMLINEYLPSVATGLQYINDFFDYILSFIPYILSWFNIPTLFIELVIAYYVFKLTVPFIVHTVKLALAWYEKIIP